MRVSRFEARGGFVPAVLVLFLRAKSERSDEICQRLRRILFLQSAANCHTIRIISLHHLSSREFDRKIPRCRMNSNCGSQDFGRSCIRRRSDVEQSEIERIIFLIGTQCVSLS